jgi:hypothetical protein
MMIFSRRAADARALSASGEDEDEDEDEARCDVQRASFHRLVFTG